MSKKREYKSSELIKSLSKIYGFEEKLLAFEIKDFFRELLDSKSFSEIERIDLLENRVIVKINSPLLKYDFQMRRTEYLIRLIDFFGEDKIKDLLFL